MRYDQLSPELLEEKVWDDKDFSADLTYVVEHEGQLVGFMMGLIRQAAPEKVGYIKMLVIDKKYQGKGIGTRLLKEMEKMLCNQGVSTIRLFEAAPNYLVPGLDVFYTKGLVFVEKYGYKRFGETFNMEVSLEGKDFETGKKEKELATRGFDIRRATAKDTGVLRTLLQQHWPAWLDEVQNSLRNKPISLHLAFYRGSPIGFSAYDCNNKGSGWFGPIGTVPEHRREGIGGILLSRCLRDLQAQGRRFATIPWVGPIGFYVRYADAEITRVFYRYQKVFE
jgi:ribosomal protein S18 acetylase RimI-like enzyme